MTTSYTVQRAVKQALFLSAATASAGSAMAADIPSEDMREVIITGSRIRRVDAETANPVMVIDQAAIAQTGVATAGELVSRIPSIAGSATNSQVNNGGGYGEANIELRGLDAKRTLILVDGRRLGLVGTTKDATDVNQIPLALIERVEVLKEGAGAIYGSDAIGGVVNFITRKKVDGLELNADYGRTSRSDGEHYSLSAMLGTSTDKMDFLLGATYTKQEAISAGDRDFSRFALYLYGAAAGITKGGSSRTPTGRIFLPANTRETTTNPGLGAPTTRTYNCLSPTAEADLVTANSTATPVLSPAALLAAQQISVTRTGVGASVTDYRCWAGASDTFNYQPLNLIMTPQEHVAIFSKLNYHVNDDVELYATVINNRTHSGYQIAPLPFDAQVDDVVLSAASIYNPFGIDFGGLTTGNPNFALRLSSVGNRRSDTSSDSKVFNGGLRGSLFDDKWDWDLNLTASRLDQLQTVYGYVLKNSLVAALGPSYVDATGAHCGTPTATISGCVPVNFFNPTAPGQAAAINSISSNYNTNNTFRYQSAALEFTGPLFALPAGELQSSFGVEYNKQEGLYAVDSIVQATPPLYLQCQLANEACTGNSIGEYDSRQLYVELYVPLLMDMPGVKKLSIDIGGRYSDYSIFGNTTKGEFKVEYRPVSDVLFRATYSQAFRVPTITDIAASPANDSVTFNDPCTNLTSAMVVANPNLSIACQGVPLSGNFKQPNGQITGLQLSSRNLKPETGNVTTFGVVYEPNFVSGLSLEVDYWQVKVKDLITQVDPNFSIAQCVATGSPTYCSLVTRFTSGASTGQILVFQEPTFNLGELETKGVDFGIRYAMKETDLGSFRFSIDATRIFTYENTPGPGATPIEVAGTYDRQFGNYAQWRAIVGIGWTMGDIEALLTSRYIHHIVLKNPSVTGVTDDGVTPYPDLEIPSVTYLDLTVGYAFTATNTKVQFGMQNITDKQPPILFQNNVTNGNTDVETYDTVGRKWWVSVSQKF